MNIMITGRAGSYKSFFVSRGNAGYRYIDDIELYSESELQAYIDEGYRDNCDIVFIGQDIPRLSEEFRMFIHVHVRYVPYFRTVRTFCEFWYPAYEFEFRSKYENVLYFNFIGCFVNFFVLERRRMNSHIPHIQTGSTEKNLIITDFGEVPAERHSGENQKMNIF